MPLSSTGPLDHRPEQEFTPVHEDGGAGERQRVAESEIGFSDPLDFSSDVPVYEQIGNRLKFAISRSAFPEGSKLPSVRALARLLLVNPNTVVRVYRDLERGGLIFSRRGVGVFVAPQAKSHCDKERQMIVEERLREALKVGRLAGLSTEELEKIWRRLLKS